MFKFSDKMYNALKWVAQILLPALATLYFALANIWGLPYTEEIVGTITSIDAFLGVILGISSKQYYQDIMEDVATTNEVINNIDVDEANDPIIEPEQVFKGEVTFTDSETDEDN